MKGCLISSRAVGRRVGSISRHYQTKSTNSFVHLDSSVRPLAGLSLIKFTIAIGLDVLNQYGGSPSAISITVIPKDQMSVF